MKYSKIQLNKMMKKNFTVSSTSSFKGKTSVLKVIVKSSYKKIFRYFYRLPELSQFSRKRKSSTFLPITRPIKIIFQKKKKKKKKKKNEFKTVKVFAKTWSLNRAIFIYKVTSI